MNLVRCLAVAVLLCGVLAASAQNPRKVGEIYDTEITAVQVKPDGTQGEASIPARIFVIGENDSDPATTATFELDVPGTVALLKINEEALPPVAAHLIGQGVDRWFMVDGRTMGRTCRLELAKDLPVATGALSPPGGQYELTILDPAGKPAAGFDVEVFAKGISPSAGVTRGISLVSRRLGADGKISFASIGQARQSGAMQFNQPWDSAPRYEIVVGDPTIGQKQTISFPPPFNPAAGKSGVPKQVCVALLDSTSDTLSFWGKVVGHDGVAVPGAGISMSWLEMPGLGGHQFWGVSVAAGPDGRFSLGLPIDWVEQNLGPQVVSPEARLQVHINGVHRGTLVPGRDNVVKLMETGTFVFEFRDEKDQRIAGLTKQIMERGGLRMIGDNTHIQPQTSEIDDKAARLKVSGVPVPRAYRVELGDLKFPEQKLEPGEPERVVVWRRSGDRVSVVGRIVDSETSAPIAGAYVLCSFEGGAAWTLNSMDPAERDEIWSKWEKGKAEEMLEGNLIKLRGGGFLHDVAGMGRTDENGEYKLTLLSGKLAQGLSVAAKGYIGARAHLLSIKGINPESGTVCPPDVGLPKAAEVSCVVEKPEVIPDPQLRDEAGKSPEQVSVGMGVGFQKPAGWNGPVIDLNKVPQIWTYVYSSSWHRFGDRVEVRVPANVKFSVTASAPYESTLGLVTWGDLGPLAPGEKQELQQRTLPARRPFLVVVKNADGSPAQGMAVRLEGAVPIYTDNKGEAIGWTSGHVERLEVYPKNEMKIAAEKKNFDIPESGEMTRVELALK